MDGVVVGMSSSSSSSSSSTMTTTVVCRTSAPGGTTSSSSSLDAQLAAVANSTDGVCRVCLADLVEQPAVHQLFHALAYENQSLADKAMSLANVKMLPGDGLPGQICMDCSNKLDMAYKFKIQVQQADAVLRERFLKADLFFENVNMTHATTDHVMTPANMFMNQETDHMDTHIIHNDCNGKSSVMHKHTSVAYQDDQRHIQNKSIDIQHQQQDHKIMQIAVSNDNHSFETQELQDFMFSEMNEQTRLAIHEHDYVMESQVCDFQHKDSDFNSQVEIKLEQNELLNETTDNQMAMDAKITETVSDQMCHNDRLIQSEGKESCLQSNEEDYYEDLNLSLRLKKLQVKISDNIFFMCYVCDRHFKSKELLKEHMSSHEELRKTFDVASKVQDIDDQNKPPSNGKCQNKCPHCGKEYLYIISFKKHLKQHEEEGKFSGASFEEDDGILNFSEYHQSINTDFDSDTNDNDQTLTKTHGKIECEICGDEQDSIESLNEHKSKHVLEGLIPKEETNNGIEYILPENSDDQKYLTEKDFSASENCNIKCPHCPQFFTQQKLLTKHLESHRYSCKICSQTFSRKDTLNKHLQEQHNMKGFGCNECGKVFGNELALRNHLIATNHKTTVHGKEYDPNKRLTRVAAKAAQKIINKLTDDLNQKGDEEGDEEEEEEKQKPMQNSVKIDGSSPKKIHLTSKVYTCDVCNDKFPSKQSLAKHASFHSKNDKEIETQASAEQEHLEQQEINNVPKSRENLDDDDDDDNFSGGDWPMDIHECPTCKKRYSTKKSLLRHQLLHDEPNFECDICNVKFFRKDKLKAHYDKCSEKNPDQVRKCNLCGDTFESNEALKKHRVKHVVEGILTEEDLRDIENRTEDKKIEKMPRKRRTDIIGLKCHLCNKEYTSRKGLLRHLQVHEGKKYLCDMCPQKFSRREDLKLHVAKHNMIKPYKCPRCPKRFIKEEQLNNHITRHDRPAKKPKDAGYPKRYLCEVCSKSFTQYTTLVAHLRAHNGIKPYVCQVCTRPFTTNAYLKMHMRTHTQERPYICQYCSRAFARADTLANHLTSHTGEAKYHCNECPKHFRRLKSLKEHIFIHTGQRPYACPTCDRTFNNNGSRYAHSKRCKQNLLQASSSRLMIQSQQQSEQHPVQEQEQHLDQLQHLQQSEQQHIIIGTALEEQTQQIIIEHDQEQRLQIIKPQNIITITKPDGTMSQQHLVSQEVLMPLLLPLSVTLTEVDEDAILPEGSKIFTT
ncbi:hypothetical protein TKK_0007523 [Trichogramma kaykai]|uniref:Uncharacterized protein n=1 Tax=Trichogramma kaykai TaxID=54128 RepID=A0ABD2WFP2_9HYME